MLAKINDFMNFHRICIRKSINSKSSIVVRDRQQYCRQSATVSHAASVIGITETTRQGHRCHWPRDMATGNVSRDQDRWQWRQLRAQFGVQATFSSGKEIDVLGMRKFMEWDSPHTHTRTHTHTHGMGLPTYTHMHMEWDSPQR